MVVRWRKRSHERPALEGLRPPGGTARALEQRGAVRPRWHPPPPALGGDGGPHCFLRQVQRRSTLRLRSAALFAEGVLKAGKGGDAGGARLTTSGPRRAQ